MSATPPPVPVPPAPRAPKVGESVHVEGDGGACAAAIVTRACGLTPCVQVFLDAPDDGGRFTSIRSSVAYDDAEKPAAGTWHWPEK